MKGFSAPLLGSMAESAVLFLGYNQSQLALRHLTGKASDQPLSLAEVSACGFVAGGFVSCVLTPVELVKW